MYVTGEFITAFTRSRDLLLSRATSTQAPPNDLLEMSFNTILQFMYVQVLHMQSDM